MCEVLDAPAKDTGQVYDIRHTVQRRFERACVEQVRLDRGDVRTARQFRRGATRQRTNLYTVACQGLDERAADETAGSSNKDNPRGWRQSW